MNLGIFRWERGLINHSELKELETPGKVPRPQRLHRKLTKGLNVALLLNRSQLSFQRLSLHGVWTKSWGFLTLCFVLKIYNDIRHLCHMLHILDKGNNSSSIVFFFLRMPRRNMNYESSLVQFPYSIFYFHIVIFYFHITYNFLVSCVLDWCWPGKCST